MKNHCYLIIFLAVLFNSQANALTPSCIAGQKSIDIIMIFTEHTIAYAKPVLCKPLNIVDFTVTKGQNNNTYTLNWSKQDHNLWYVQNYEVRVNSTAIHSYGYSTALPLSLNIGGDLASFEVRACSSAPSNDPSAPP